MVLPRFAVDAFDLKGENSVFCIGQNWAMAVDAFDLKGENSSASKRGKSNRAVDAFDLKGENSSASACPTMRKRPFLLWMPLI